MKQIEVLTILSNDWASPRGWISHNVTKLPKFQMLLATPNFHRISGVVKCWNYNTKLHQNNCGLQNYETKIIKRDHSLGLPAWARWHDLACEVDLGPQSRCCPTPYLNLNSKIWTEVSMKRPKSCSSWIKARRWSEQNPNLPKATCHAPIPAKKQSCWQCEIFHFELPVMMKNFGTWF